MNFSSRIINKFLKNSVIIFVYHDVSSNPSQFSKKYNLNISPELFFTQVKLINNMFNVISPNELIKGDFERPAALFTFDDGFKSYFDNALPILDEFKCPSVNFINYDVIKGELFWPCLTTYLCDNDPDYADYKILNKINIYKEPEFLFLDENSVDRYVKQTNKKRFYKLVRDYQGDFANETDLLKSNESYRAFLGSHLYKHLNCANISLNYLIELQNKNVKYLSKYSNYINYFAYPFGQPIQCFNNKTNSVLIQKNVNKIFSSSGSINFDSSTILMDRIDLNQTINSKKLLMKHLMKKFIYNNIKKGFN